MTFREVLLIGGENVKTQVQQLNEGVSSQRDSLSKCMCTNNHTFSKPKLKQKNKQLPVKYRLFSLREYSSISRCRSERWERGRLKYSHENGLLNGRLEQRLLVDFYLEAVVSNQLDNHVFAPPQRRVSYAV